MIATWTRTHGRIGEDACREQSIIMPGVEFKVTLMDSH